MKKFSKVKNSKALFGSLLGTVCMVIADIILVNASGFFALFTRFEFDFGELVSSGFLESFLKTVPASTVAAILIFALFRLYSSVWAYAGVGELIRIICACFLSNVFDWVYIRLMPYALPRSYVIIRFLLLIGFISCLRFSGRISRLASS